VSKAIDFHGWARAAPARPARTHVLRALLLPLLLPLLLQACVQTARSGTVNPPAPPAPVAVPAPAAPARPVPVAPRPPAHPAPSTPVPRPVAPAANAATGTQVRGAGAAVLAATSVALLESSRRHVAVGELDAAAADLERALDLEPNQPRLWLELAEVRLRQGRREQARNVARRAQSLVGNDAVLAARAADVLRRAGG
jgi:tetratricopeptide (TPR) repeat protein